MDSSRFDALTKTLTTRQPRRAAFTLLAALGLGLVSSETGAAKKNGEKKVRVCTCSGADASTCTTQKKAKDTVKKLLRRNPCAYKGRCIGVSGCATLTPVTPDLVAPNPGFQCTNNNDCTGGLVCIGQTCQACTESRQCGGTQVCLNGTCQNPGLGPGSVCPALCPACQVCNPATGQCEVCPANCRYCFSVTDRTTVCGDFFDSGPCRACTTSADDCPTDFPHCVGNFTELDTNQSSAPCGGGIARCLAIGPCA